MVQLGKLRIPMRGYEPYLAGIMDASVRVTNPHEGL